MEFSFVYSCQTDGIEQKMLDSRNECFKLLSTAQLALTKTTGQPENDLRDARNNATLIDNQNKRNKEFLDSIDKYSLLSTAYFL